MLIFTEKDAISGVILPVSQRWDVPLGVIRGYCLGILLLAGSAVRHGRPRRTCYIYQLGDHDPSGVDAWRAFTDKVFSFVAERYGDAESWLHFERLAVTPVQITTMNLPTRPTKQTDSRAAKFDGESVEVDAIPAPVLRQLVEDAITQYIDRDALRVTRFAEQSERDLLTEMRRMTGGAA